MPDECQRQLALARRQLEATQRISAALFSVTDLDALQRLALQTAMEVVDADAGSLMLHEPEQDALVFRYVVGPVADILTGTRLDLSRGLGIAGQVFRSGQSRITMNAEQDTDHIGTVDAQTGYRTRSLMTVPLLRRNAPPLGVVQFLNKREGDFDAADVAVIEVLGSLVVMAVHNAVLAERAKLAAVARSIGEISHDIGNMLTHVLPYVQSLEVCIADVREGRPGAIDFLESFYREVVSSVTEGVEQVEARTKEIAGAIKGEVAPMVFERGQPFKTVLRVLQSLRASANKREVMLYAEGDEALEAVYDGPRLYNAVYNLVNNALPETPAGGRVTVTVASDADPDFYTVSVCDTGAGMPADVRESLFTDSARSTKPGGTGLGTRIVRRIVEQHGGTPSVVSALDQGTTITLRLPKQPPPSQETFE